MKLVVVTHAWRVCLMLDPTVLFVVGEATSRVKEGYGKWTTTLRLSRSMLDAIVLSGLRDLIWGSSVRRKPDYSICLIVRIYASQSIPYSLLCFPRVGEIEHVDAQSLAMIAHVSRYYGSRFEKIRIFACQ